MTRKVSPALPEELLPKLFYNLLVLWDAIDKIYCFMSNRKMQCTISKLSTLYSSLHGGKILCVEELALICSVCPEICAVRRVSLDVQSHELEFIFNSSVEASSKSHISKRRKLLFDKLVSIAYVQYFQFCEAHTNGVLSHSEREYPKVAQTGSWPTGFPVDSCTLPTPSQELLQLCDRYNRWKESLQQPESSSDTSSSSAATGSDQLQGPEGGHGPVAAESISDLGGALGVLEALKAEAFYKDQLVHMEHIPGRSAVFAELAPPSLPPLLVQRMTEATGLQQLYLHQARAIDALRQGRHAVVSTSTASGKSVIYNIPVLEAVLRDPATTALYLFPTKALAQDQLRSLLAVTGDGAHLPVSCAVCDGDTAQCERARIMYPAEVGAPNVILTNPDMLHCTLLPDHRAWRRIFENIKFVVIDEAHQYRGAFGAHVACVLRRLLRVCLYYGRCPQFLCCSATIANPAEHMMKLVPLRAVHISCDVDGPGERATTESESIPERSKELAVIGAALDGSPQGDRLFVIWNPSLRQDCQQPKKVLSMREGPSDVATLPVATATPATVKAAATELAKEDIILQQHQQCPSSDPSQLAHCAPTTESAELFERVHSDLDYVSAPSMSQRDVTTTTTNPGLDPDFDNGFSPKKARFLLGCGDTRPATMGAARSLTVHDPLLGARIPTATRVAPSSSSASAVVSCATQRHSALPELKSNPDYEVKYVGGWKRGRTQARTGTGTGGFRVAQPEDSTCGVGSAGNEVVPAPTALLVAQERRTSTIWEASCLLAALVRQRLRTLAFCRTRKLVELVLGYSLRQLDASNAGHLKGSVVSYRGGYTKEERRAIESDLFSGRVLGVTATCALELGIDVGALDATLHMGFPGSFSSLWQQAGRAGRSGRPSLSVVVCFDCPIDQYFVRNPQVLFHSPVEPAVLDVGNVHILYSHLLCAAAEVPLNYSFHLSTSASAAVSDAEVWGERYLELLQYLLEAHKITPLQNDGSSRGAAAAAVAGSAELSTAVFRASSVSASRASQVSLRQIDPVTIRVLDDSRGGVEIDSLGYSRAFFELFEGAIYMHRAEQLRVISLDLVAKVAHCRPVKVKYYTSASNSTMVNVTRVIESDGVCSSGTVQVVSSVYGYVKRWLGSGEVFEKGECSLPPLEYETSAFWIDLPLRIKRELEKSGMCPVSSIHAANHAILAMAPLYAQCDATDVDTEHTIVDSAVVSPFRIMIFDTRTGGLGASSALYHRRREVLCQARDLVSGCDCCLPSGCPCCTLSTRCTRFNNDLSRCGAKLLLQLLVQHFDAYHAAAPGGFLPVNVTAGHLSANSTAATTTATTAAQASSGGGGGGGADPSPRKARRKKALSATAFRDRAKKMAIQLNWTESVPSFYQDGDING